MLKRNLIQQTGMCVLKHVAEHQWDNSFPNIYVQKLSLRNSNGGGGRGEPDNTLKPSFSLVQLFLSKQHLECVI